MKNIEKIKALKMLVAKADIPENIKKIILEGTRAYDKVIEEQKKLIFVDPLTGLYNRRYLDESLKRETSLSNRHGNPLSYVIADIDKFKSCNDNYGHNIGDKVLQKVASQIKSAIRATDIACRYGGEELAIILPRTELEETYSITERLRAGIEKLIFNSEKGQFSISASFGISEYNPSEKIEDFMKRADKCLYYAKENGRNKVIFEIPIIKSSA